MRRYTVEEEQIIKVVKCNKCGKELPLIDFPFRDK